MPSQMNEYMKKQPITNIGCMGSVSDGKSTTVFQLTGSKTQRHSEEQIRNITVKPGYANMKVWLDREADDYKTTNSKIEEMDDYELINHISFVDCPGHHSLILAMMSSVSLMKGAIVVVSAAEPLENKPQLIQHLAAAKMAGIDKKLIILFNKLDLISIDTARERKEELDNLLVRFEIVPKYIIPTALNRKIGLKNVIKAITEVFAPEDAESVDDNVEFRITRSFDVNIPGTNWDAINGGVIGGSLLSGKLKIGDELEIRPGIWSKKKDGTFIVQPIKSKVISLQSDKESLTEIIPGGLTSIGTEVDSFYCKNDKLSGNIIGVVGKCFDVFSKITIDEVVLTEDFDAKWIPKLKDTVYLQIGNVNTEAILLKMNKDSYYFELSKPSCIKDNSLITICIKSDEENCRIAGYGNQNSSTSNKINLN
jgi:translation initiation factor 2 subunit 3